MRTASIGEVIESLCAAMKRYGDVPVVVIGSDEKVYGVLSLEDCTLSNEHGEDHRVAALKIGAHWSEHN